MNIATGTHYSRMSRLVLSLLVSGYWGFLSPGLKQPAHEGDHSLPSVPPLCLHVMGRDRFTVVLT